ncbi:unnamed protein product [Owenia fusiformis]|uniref:TBC1 domain family member 7 n=1 Tax=Owenia fusiformis TaxID=6347 RepID=A0A8S4P2Z3_OWEFU|nr:unnamed protein product [Owenia fusiformis]
MAEAERNFRSYYYDKVGFRGVDEKKSIEILLKETPLDLRKLGQFCLRFPLPVVYRNLVWKVLLGVLPKQTDVHTFAQDQLLERYNELHHALKLMRKITKDTELATMFLKMHHVNEGTLLFDDDKMLDAEENKAFLSIAGAMLEIAENETEAFWMTTHFHKLQKNYVTSLPGMIERTEYYLKREDKDGKLYEHLSKHRVLSSLPMSLWYKSSFAGVLPETSFERIWDKVIGGSCKILVFLMVSTLLTLKRPLLSMNSSQEIVQYLNKISSDSADIIVSKSLDLWQKYGSLLLPSSKGNSPVVIQERPPS